MSQENPDNEYDKWQQEHDQRRRDFYDNSQANTYEYDNNSSFTATPQKDYSSSQSIFGSSETSQQNSQYSSQSEHTDYIHSRIPENLILDNIDHLERCNKVLEDLTAYATFSLANSSNHQQNDAFMYPNNHSDAESTVSSQD